MDQMLTLMVQPTSFECNQCRGELTEESIALILWGGKRGISKVLNKIIVNAHYCKHCENWILDNDLYNQLKSDYPKLRISTTNLMRYMDQSKKQVVPYHPVSNRQTAYNDKAQIQKCSISV